MTKEKDSITELPGDYDLIPEGYSINMGITFLDNDEATPCCWGCFQHYKPNDMFKTKTGTGYVCHNCKKYSFLNWKATWGKI